MKAVVVYESGSPEKLIYTDVATPKIKKGWSLVKVKGFGINHSEIFTRAGQSPSVSFPRILGIECVRIIEETSDEKRLPVGQKIISIMGEMGRDFDGSYAEYVLLPNEQIYPIETQLPWEQLTTLPETYYTAFGSFKNLQIKKGDRVLVRGATSGVGIAFLNLIKAQFSDMIIDGTTRDMSKEEQLLSAGFNHVIEDKQNILKTSNRYDKILELIGPRTTENSFKHLNEGGIICITGLLGGEWTLNQFDPIMAIQANSYLTSFYSGNVDEIKINELLGYVETHNVLVKPEKIFNLSEVKEAHQYLESSKSIGKVIVIN